MSFRRFVNLVSTDPLKMVYTLRRIDMWRFFFPTINGTTNQQQHDSASSCLPDPVINFYSSPNANNCGDMEFMLVDDDKVVATDGTGTFMYDTGKHAVRILPSSHARFKKFPTSLTVGSDIYVIDRVTTNGTGTRGFQALVCTAPAPTLAKQGDWHWHVLPSPPPPRAQELDDRTSIDSCAAAADGSRIWMSAIASGQRGAVKSCTHLFDTWSLVWSKRPADWVLPFTGNAQYVPELQKLWFGIASRDHGHAFCAADLATASLSQAPTLHTVFDDGMAARAPGECLTMAQAAYLGSGRFFVAKVFTVPKPPTNSSQNDLVTYNGAPIHLLSYDEEIFMVLAGVEVVTGGDGELSLVKHHSERYILLDHELHWVL